MKIAYCLVVAFVVGLVSGNAYAYTPNGSSVTINRIITWEDASDAKVVISLSSGHYCHFDSSAANGKTLLSLATAAYLAGKSIDIWCYDTTANVNGITSRSVHRFQFSL